MEAEKLWIKAIAIGEKTLGDQHPDVAVWYNNLANLKLQQVRTVHVVEPLKHTTVISPPQRGVVQIL